jgi:hypothetical protein
MSQHVFCIEQYAHWSDHPDYVENIDAFELFATREAAQAKVDELNAQAMAAENASIEKQNQDRARKVERAIAEHEAIVAAGLRSGPYTPGHFEKPLPLIASYTQPPFRVSPVTLEVHS